MKSGFEGALPRRKPRTRLSNMLADIPAADHEAPSSPENTSHHDDDVVDEATKGAQDEGKTKAEVRRTKSKKTSGRKSRVRGDTSKESQEPEVESDGVVQPPEHRSGQVFSADSQEGSIAEAPSPQPTPKADEISSPFEVYEVPSSETGEISSSGNQHPPTLAPFEEMGTSPQSGANTEEEAVVEPISNEEESLSSEPSSLPTSVKPTISVVDVSTDTHFGVSSSDLSEVATNAPVVSEISKDLRPSPHTDDAAKTTPSKESLNSVHKLSRPGIEPGASSSSASAGANVSSLGATSTKTEVQEDPYVASLRAAVQARTRTDERSSSSSDSSSSVRPRSEAPAAEVVKAGRERIEALRARLAEANRRTLEPSPEPSTMASKVRATVEALRNELIAEKDARRTLQSKVDRQAAHLSALQEELKKEKRARENAEALAAERERVTAELLDESEALAEERDRALSRIAELRTLESTRGEILSELETALQEKDVALELARRRMQELQEALDSSSAEMSLTELKLADAREVAEQAAHRVAALEKEVAEASETRDALLEIQKVVDGS